MYYNSPIEQDKQCPRPTRELWNNNNSWWTERSLVPTPNMSNIEDESFSAILANLDDHKASPPLLTPNALTHLLNYQIEMPTRPKDSSRSKYKELIQNIKLLAVALDEQGVSGDLLESINNDKQINKYLGPSDSSSCDEGGDDVLERLSSMIAKFTSSISTTTSSEQHKKTSPSISTSIPSSINVEEAADKPLVVDVRSDLESPFNSFCI